jgi:hypothetical protein
MRGELTGSVNFLRHGRATAESSEFTGMYIPLRIHRSGASGEPPGDGAVRESIALPSG